MSGSFIIGIDAGGTKTLGRIKNLATGDEYESSKGPSSLTNDFDLSVQHVTALCQELLFKFNAPDQSTDVVIGIAGAGNLGQKKRFEAALKFEFRSLDVRNDCHCALYGANQGKPAIVIALGTGSIGGRLNEDGTRHYFDGWGFPIADNCSGAKMGYNAIRVLIDELDHTPNNLSQLASTLFNRFDHNKDQLLDWLRTAKPNHFAQLTYDVVELTPQCPKAEFVINQHKSAVVDLIMKCQSDEALPLYLSGGLAELTLPLLADTGIDAKLVKNAAINGAMLLAEQAHNDPTLRQSKREDDEFSRDLIRQLDKLTSEERNQDSKDLDLLSTDSLLSLINKEDQKVANAITPCIPKIAAVVDKVAAAFQHGGRLLYIGAGTSGRLGILDAVECPPTFSTPKEQVVGIIAGGEKAIYQAVEGAEDDPDLGETDLKKHQLSDKDVVIGIAASGRTPYVIGALTYAKSIGAFTASVSCNDNSMVAKAADVGISPVVGPEVLTGSTRLKSGTAQKLVLNMITTAAMIRSGKAFENLMVDVNASNKKLYTRAIRIVMQATGCTFESAETALKQTRFKAKPAIMHVLTGLDVAQCERMLKENGGFLREAINAFQSSQRVS